MTAAEAKRISDQNSQLSKEIYCKIFDAVQDGEYGIEVSELTEKSKTWLINNGYIVNSDISPITINW